MKKTISMAVVLALLMATYISADCNKNNVKSKKETSMNGGHSSFVNAKEEILMPQGIHYQREGNTTQIRIIEHNLIKDYIEMNNLEVPEGSTLTEIIYIENKLEAPKNNNKQSRAIVAKNVVTRSGYYVYSGQEEYDILYNYSTTTTDLFTTEYSQTKEANFSVNAGITVGVGFAVRGEVTNKKTYSTKIPPRTKVKIKVQTNYLVKDFDIYDTGLLNDKYTYIGKGVAWTPVGLIIEKYKSNI
ncbi:MAG: hypothetical protein ACK5LT_05005 [Lachnospirales bacterium]